MSKVIWSGAQMPLSLLAEHTHIEATTAQRPCMVKDTDAEHSALSGLCFFWSALILFSCALMLHY